MLAAGTRIAGYVIEGVLGEGGMGVVYEAEQPSLKRTVALKLLARELASDADFKERFRREAIFQATIDHPNIVPVYEVGESDAGLFLAMRLIRGPSLKDLIAADALAPERAVELLSPIAAALDAAHAAGCIHRDVKPENVLVSQDWHPFLTDFGVTKAAGDSSLTQTGRFVGTAAYAAPEQIGGAATRKSDIYAFGAMLYECVTGRLPFPAPTVAEALVAHLRDAPPRASELRGDLPPGLDDVIERALAKDPDDRPDSASELVDEAGRALRGEPPGPAAAVTFITPPEPPRREQAAEPPLPSGERGLLLSRVAQSYAAYLDQSLEGTIHLDLVLELLPEAVARPSDRVLPVRRRRATLPPGTSLLDVFDDAGGINGDGLLVLGDPGAGKTTLLVDLAAALEQRARRDPRHPLPVYLPLSTWVVRRPPLADWVVEQLERLYKVAPATGRRALERSRPLLMLLLDGLDEVATHDDRIACAAEVNRFAGAYPIPVVVTTRRAEYESFDLLLELETAVLVQPLSPEAVLDRLRERDARAHGVVALIEQDRSLLDLLKSPLLVNMLTLAYAGRESSDIPMRGPPAGRLDRLIEDYLQRRLELERQTTGASNTYPPERTRHWLATLASGLEQHQQTIFLLERIRPDLLPSARAAQIVRMAPKLAFGFGAGLITFAVAGEIGRRLDFHEVPALHIVIWSAFGLVAALLEGSGPRARMLGWTAAGLPSGALYALLIGIDDVAGLLSQALYYVLIFGLVGELLIRLVPPEPEPAERLSWSWPRARPYVVPGLLVGAVAGPAFGLLFSLTIESQGATVRDRGYWSLVFGPTIGLLWALSRGAGRGLTASPQTVRRVPNEGIRQSARHGLLVGIVTLLIVVAIGLVGFAGWLLIDGGGDRGEAFAMVMLLSTAWGTGCGLLLGIASGGGAAIQHWALRLLLWRYRLAPLRYARWLAYGVRLRLLYWGVGGGHMFIHRVVQDHFARNVEPAIGGR